MKILQIVGDMRTIGGMTSYVRRLTESLIAGGHETVMVAERGEREAGRSRSKVRLIHGLTSSSRRTQRRALAELLELAEKFEAGAILTHHMANGRLLDFLNQRCLTVEFVHTFFHGGGKVFRRNDTICEHRVSNRCLIDWYMGPCGSDKWPSELLRRHRQALQHLRAMRRLQGVIVGSDYMRSLVVNEGVDGEKVHVTDMTLGLPPEKPVLRDERGGPHNILYVGRLVYDKGVQYGIRALVDLDRSFSFTVVGDGWYRTKLEELARELRVRDRIEFKGFLVGHHLDAAYDQASLVVVPSLVPEPVGLVVAEARTRGIPVVAFNVGGLGEWAERFRSIYLAESASVESLRSGISRAAALQPSDSRAGVQHSSERPSVGEILSWINAHRPSTAQPDS